MRMDMSNNIGILTVSDTRNASNDESGSNLIKIVKKSVLLKANVTCYQIVRDNEEEIKKVLTLWSDDKQLNLILTTGGTGFSSTDVTPEATAKIIEKEANGLSLTMMLESLKITPYGALSRSKCGIRKNTLIVNLPGSKKAAEECFLAIAPVLPHALDSINDRKQNIKKTHIKVQHDHTCVGMHNHEDIPVAKRLRKSPFEMVNMTDAYKIVIDNANVKDSIFIRYLDALNYVLAEDIFSQESLPGFPASIKDGYALLAKDTPGDLAVIGASVCGTPMETKHYNFNGKTVRITTGAPIPPGCDAVVQVEDTEVLEQSESGDAEVKVRFLTKASVGQDIRPVGTDVMAGECVLKAGTTLSPSEIGVLASIGKTEISVYALPVVGVLSTGSELTEAHKQKLDYGEIRDSNRVSILLLLKRHGFPTVDLNIVKDDLKSLTEVLINALSKVDVLVTSGGVSMGEKDYMKSILEGKLNAKIHFGRLFMKPGKPTTFATCMLEGKRKLIFALPGNPASAMVTSNLFVIPALRKMKGMTNFDLTTIKAKLSEDIKLDPRPEYYRCHLNWDVDNDNLPIAISTGNQISSRLMSLKNSNCLVKLPPKSEVQAGQLKRGDLVDVLVIDNIS